MKICKNCGAENFDVYTECQKCKQPLIKNFTGWTSQEGSKLTIQDNYRIVPSGLNIAAKILMILSTIERGITSLILIILWIMGLASEVYEAKLTAAIIFIPMWIAMIFTIISLKMTSSYAKKTMHRQPISTSFKVCTLLFISLVAGILMFCDVNNGQTIRTTQSIPQGKSQ